MANEIRITAVRLEYTTAPCRSHHDAWLSVRGSGALPPQAPDGWSPYLLFDEAADLVGRHLYGIGPTPLYVVADCSRERPGDLRQYLADPDAGPSDHDSDEDEPDPPREVAEAVADLLTEAAKTDTAPYVDPLWLDTALVSRAADLDYGIVAVDLMCRFGGHPEMREVVRDGATTYLLTGTLAEAWMGVVLGQPDSSDYELTRDFRPEGYATPVERRADPPPGEYVWGDPYGGREAVDDRVGLQRRAAAE